MKTSQKIIDYIRSSGQATAPELVDYLGITDRAVRKQLKSLFDTNKLVKVGRPPKVYYSRPSESVNIVSSEALLKKPINSTAKKTINNNFLYITPRGTVQEGFEGFIYWCQERHLDIAKTADFYQKTLAKYGQYRNENGLIDGMYKMKSTFSDVALDKVFYLDFYAIEVFGKTKLGQMLLFAKQSQDRKLINELADTIAPDIDKVIKQHSIDGVGFIPPTVKRELQLMKQLEKRLNLNLKTLTIIKVKTPVAVAQKTLNKLEDRIINAKETIMVEGSGKYKNILLIDDAVGSGSTLNETAKKIRQKNMCNGDIIGLAITGSFKGFEVISEV